MEIMKRMAINMHNNELRISICSEMKTIICQFCKRQIRLFEMFMQENIQFQHAAFHFECYIPDK